MVFLIAGTLSSNAKILPAATNPLWRLGENESALPIDQDPTITTSDTLQGIMHL